MSQTKTISSRLHWSLQATIAATLLMAVFIFDLTQPLGVAAGVAYAAIIMVGLLLHSKKMIWGLTIVGSLLTVLDLFLQQTEVPVRIVVTNRLLVILLIWVTTYICLRQLRSQEQLATHLYQTQHHSDTGLPNRNNLFNRGEQILRAARQREQDIFMLLFAVDEYPSLVDHRGVVATAAVTEKVAQFFTARRQGHYVANLDGGVFVLILTGINHRFAIGHCKALLHDARQLTVKLDDQTIDVSVSACVCQARDSMVSIVDLLRAADDGLRQARKQGRNQLVVANTPD